MSWPAELYELQEQIQDPEVSLEGFHHPEISFKNSSIDIKKSPKGLGYVTQKELVAGSLLLIESPLVIFVSWKKRFFAQNKFFFCFAQKKGLLNPLFGRGIKNSES